RKAGSLHPGKTHSNPDGAARRAAPVSERAPADGADSEHLVPAGGPQPAEIRPQHPFREAGRLPESGPPRLPLAGISHEPQAGHCAIREITGLTAHTESQSPTHQIKAKQLSRKGAKT